MNVFVMLTQELLFSGLYGRAKLSVLSCGRLFHLEIEFQWLKG